MLSRFTHGLIVASIAALAAPVAAQDEDSEPAEPGGVAEGAETTPPDPVDDPVADDEDDDKGDKPDINLGGRVFVRNTTRRAHVDGAELQNDLGFESVRGNIDLRAYGWLRTGIEITFEEDGEIGIDDVFVEVSRDLGHGDVELIAGRFKRPMSAIAMESIYEMPILERGILGGNVDVPDFTVPLNLGGRSDAGVMAHYDGDEGIKPQLYLGLFTADLPRRRGSGEEPADVADNLLRDVYGRVSIEPLEGFEVGGSLALVTRARRLLELESRLIGSLDLHLSTRRFRVWLEGFAGKTPYFDGTEANGNLLGLRVLAAPRWNRPIPALRRVEPFVILSVLDPTDKTADNRAIEAGGGLAVQIAKPLHITLEYVYNAYDDNFPAQGFSFVDTSTVRLQISSQFR